ncbi:MAG: tripartite tricarboxylate transporter TctB family protein [Alphaproteobacteria bacterium]|nr:tripartite tricarboxylate transporter TctB family protein [Alphaproteobacteria bacterium]
MKLSDRTSGIFLVVLGALAAYGGSRLPPVPGQQIGPNVFPMVVGLGLAICGALIAIGAGRVFEEEAAADLAAHADASAPATKPGMFTAWKALLPPALLIFYVFVSERLGFVPTAAVMIFTLALTLGARIKLALPLALLAPIGVHLVFYKLLRVPLPPGLLPMPW